MARRKPDEFVLRLNEMIYDAAVIDKAIDDFKDACIIEKAPAGLVFRSCEKDMSAMQCGYEFSNYVLGLMKNK